MWAWQFSKMQYTAELIGWTKFVSMQDQYSLIMREEEREMFPLLADQGVGSIPWSPLAGGLVARPCGQSGTPLTDDEVTALEGPYAYRKQTWFSQANRSARALTQRRGRPFLPARDAPSTRAP